MGEEAGGWGRSGRGQAKVGRQQGVQAQRGLGGEVAGGAGTTRRAHVEGRRQEAGGGSRGCRHHGGGGQVPGHTDTGGDKW